MRNVKSMIGLLAACLFLQSVAMGQDSPIRWEPTLDSAQRLAGQTNRLVLVQFWANWCGVCKRMEAEVFSQPSVAANISANYVPVKVNADHFPATAQQYGVTALPTTIVITPQGQLVGSIRGRVEIAEFEGRLTQFASTARQHGTTPYAQVPGMSTQQPAAASAAIPNPNTAVVSPPTNNPPTSNVPLALVPLALNSNSVPAAQPTTAAPASVQSRYSDFMRQTQPAQTQSAQTQPTQTQPTMPTPIAQPSMAATQPATGPALSVQNVTPPNSYQTPATNPAQPYPSQTPQNAPTYMASAAPIMQNPTVQSQNPILPQPTVTAATPNAQTPPISEPMGLDGFCPVALCEKQEWTPGDRRWGAIHRGRTYLFSGPEEQRRFFANPDRYAPVASGVDIVLATEQGQSVAGMREHGVFYGTQIFLFSSEATLEKFQTNPSHYATQALGAMRSAPGQIR